jgi:hypothetical protein
LNVNFDAETASETLDCESFSGIYDLGVKWSETYQSSVQLCSSESSGLIRHLLWEFGTRFSANLVLGNAAYGLDNSNYRLLRHLALNVASAAGRELKLGAEGLTNGKKSIDIAAHTGAYAYILHTSCANALMEYARERRVKFMVYTLLRIAETRSIAAEELTRIQGTGYFERRGILREAVPQTLGDFSISGNPEEIAAQILSFIDRGASKVVLFPVFASLKDLLTQLKLLSSCLE